MKVKLITYTPNPDITVYRAARTCYQPGTIDEIAKPDAVKLKKFITKLINSGHTSPLEHVSFTFAIEDCSRVVSHELVRHRIASYSQQSQRYVDYSNDIDLERKVYIPADIFSNGDALGIYKCAILQSIQAYNALIDMGIAPQDARYVLPNATPVQIVCTFNARSLLNFFKLRCCRRAQPEMQELAFEMLFCVKKVAPVIFKNAGRQCAACTEEIKCKEMRENNA